MPTLVRFLVVLIVLAAIGLAGMFYLANFVEPRTREMIVKVPADRLQPKEVPAPVAAAPAPAPVEATPAAADAPPAAAPADPPPVAPTRARPRFKRGRGGH